MGMVPPDDSSCARAVDDGGRCQRCRRGPGGWIADLLVVSTLELLQSAAGEPGCRARRVAAC